MSLLENMFQLLKRHVPSAELYKKLRARASIRMTVKTR